MKGVKRDLKWKEGEFSYRLRSAAREIPPEDGAISAARVKGGWISQHGSGGDTVDRRPRFGPYARDRSALHGPPHCLFVQSQRHLRRFSGGEARG